MLRTHRQSPESTPCIPSSHESDQTGQSLPVHGPPPDRMLTIHHLAVDDLLEADRLGGLPSPSLGITKLDTPFLGFGEISLIGTRDMADPRHTTVYPCDADTPSAPRNGHDRKLRAADLAEATCRMISSAARRRGGPYNLSRLLVETGVRFATPEDIQAARSRLVDSDTARDEREYLGRLLDAYVRDAARCRPERLTSQQTRESAAMKSLAHACRHGATREALGSALERRRFQTVPKPVLLLGEQVMRALREHVTDYFEAKPARAVYLREFAGAVVPAGAPAEVFHILRRTGLRLKCYAKYSQARAIRVLAMELARDRPDILYRSAAFPQEKRQRFRRADLSFHTQRLNHLAFRFTYACALMPPCWLLALLCGVLLRHSLGLCLFHIIMEAMAAP